MRKIKLSAQNITVIITTTLTLVGTIVVATFAFLSSKAPIELSLHATQTAETVKSLIPTSTAFARITKPEKIELQSDCYHIGDVEYVSVVKNGQVVDKIYFCHPPPQENPFSKNFDLPYTFSSARLYLTVKHIDPNEKSSPVKVFINGVFVDYINRYVTQETISETVIYLSIDPSLLKEKENNIQIFVEPNKVGFFTNTDDIEFKDMYLEVYP